MNSDYNIQSRKILYVVNPKSGTQKDDALTIISGFHSHNSDVEVNYLFPDWKNFHEQLDAAYKNGQYDTIVACGGDGTVRAVAEYIYDKDIKLGILPMGSSNGLAKNLNIPMDMESALNILYNAVNIQKISSISINGLFSIHLADAGINARIVRRFEHTGKRGIWGYILAGIRVLRDYEYYYVSIRSGDETHHFKACMIVIANANMYGTGFVINNTGNLNDDVFEIVIIKQLSFNGFIKMALNNWEPDPGLIHVIKAKSAEIDSEYPLSLQIDGEYIGKVKKISTRINPGHISVIVP